MKKSTYHLLLLLALGLFPYCNRNTNANIGVYLLSFYNSPQIEMKDFYYGHASRWSVQALKLLWDNGVYCFFNCIAHINLGTAE
jgi:hypothetical protein